MRLVCFNYALHLYYLNNLQENENTNLAKKNNVQILGCVKQGCLKNESHFMSSIFIALIIIGLNGKLMASQVTLLCFKISHSNFHLLAV